MTKRRTTAAIAATSSTISMGGIIAIIFLSFSLLLFTLAILSFSSSSNSSSIWSVGRPWITIGAPVVNPSTIAPPVKTPLIYTNGMSLPPPIETRPAVMDYTNLGILSDGDTVMPIFGKRTQSARDKWNYFTMSNNGIFPNRLPIRIGKRSCLGEPGCDELTSGESVHVDGYNKNYKATIYETEQLSYNPNVM